MQTTMIVTGLNWIMKLAIGSGAWLTVQAHVERWMTEDLPGPDKQKIAYEGIRQAGVQIATYLLNLAIEAAVARFKLQPPAA